MPETILPCGFFCLRTHLLPFDHLLRWSDGLTAASADAAHRGAALDADRALLRARLRAIVDRPEIREALFVASPALHDAIAMWIADPAGDRGRRAERSLLKYVARLTSRPTPFGLFAGVATGRIARDTAVVVAPPGRCLRHTRLDNEYLFTLAHALNADPDVRRAARYRPNDSLALSAGHGRYAEARPAKVGHTFHLVRVEETKELRETLARAESPGGATREALATALMVDDIAPEEAEAFVDELIQSQLLVSDVAVRVTGPEPAAVLADRVAVIPSCRLVAERLREAVAALERLDAAPLGNSPSCYQEIAAGLQALPAPVELPRLFQVDLVRPDAGTLGEVVCHEIRRGVELLHRIAPAPEPAPLDHFTRRFVERYHGRAVPLLEALDDEVGIGAALWPAADPSPLLRDFPLAPAAPAPPEWTPRSRHLLHQAGVALAEGRAEWRLEASDLELLADPSPPPLAGDFAAFATLAATSAVGIPRGEFELHLAHVAPGAARLLGRFCHADAELHRCVAEQFRREESRDPEAIHAEVVHLSEGRLGNILLRPVLREWEITYLGHSGAAPEYQIPASDLLLSEREGRLELWSARLGRRVVPRLTTAHNTSAGLTPYRFLALLEYQGRAPALLWDWGPAAELPFLPRVVHGRLVLSLARYRLSRGEIRRLSKGTDSERFAALQEFQARRRVPRWVTLADDDHRLPLDLDNPLAVDTLLHEIGDQDAAILEELWPGPDRLVARGPDGGYRHELVVPFMLERPEPATAPRRPLVVEETGPRRFPPGSEWLYLKLYTSAAESDAILEEVVGPLSRRWVERGWVSCWFFIRYADPDPHIRWRLRGDPAVLWRKVWPAIERALAQRVASGAISRMVLDTYEREVERYGGRDAIGHAEEIFQADSAAVIELLGMFDQGDAGLDERWRLALAGADRLFGDFGLSLPERLRQLQKSARYGAVPDPGPALRPQFTQRFREHRPAIETLLNPDSADQGPLAPGLAVLRERSARIAPEVAALSELARSGRLTVSLGELAGSVIHMHVNRLLSGAPNAHETVLYDFLRRAYAGIRGRAR